MQLFYQPNLSISDTYISFDKEESRHIVKVLRRQKGDILHITNGKGLLFRAVIESDMIKKCTAKILDSEEGKKLPYYLHLAVAPTKMNDRYEWFLEKAVEIGVSEITPLICEHSERTIVKTDRFERVMVAAMKQSLHTFLPKLNNPINFKDFISNQEENHSQKFIAHCEDSDKRLFSRELDGEKLNSVTVIIGPEGDFSPEEISLAVKNNFIPISLGDSRLRTETAAIVTCHTVLIVSELNKIE